MEDMKQKIQEAGGFLRTAERNMFSGKNTEAVELLNKADAIAIQLSTTHPDDFQVKSLIQKAEKMRKDLEKKGVKTREGGKEELPFEVNAQLLRIKESVVNGNLAYAKTEMSNYFSRFAGTYTDIPEIKELSALIEKMEQDNKQKEFEQAEVKREKETLQLEHEKKCGEWKDRIKQVPYFDGTSHNVPDLLSHIESCKKAVAVVNEYMRVEFQLEPDFTLQSMIEDLKRRVETFIPNYQNTIKEMSEEIIHRIQGHMSQLQNDKDWEKDESKKPLFLGQNQLSSILDSIEEMREACVESMDVFNHMMSTYEQLHKLNEDRKKVKVERTKMKAPAMQGNEANSLIDCAQNELRRKYPMVEVIKALVSKAWENKFEEGWEDNTKSKWIKRHFREATVQIAAKTNSDEYKLFAMYIEETKTAENTFENMKSHVMFEEAILKENI
jgi:hypothetical protein